MKRFAVLLFFALAACSRAPADDAFARRLAEGHRVADQRLEHDDAVAARAALEAAVADARGARDDDARLALQDTYFRIARLALEGHDAPGALKAADAGLALGAAPHLFVANLYVVRGSAHEALDDARAAAFDYQRALVINEALLHEGLAKPHHRRPDPAK
jgi:hypothetical protein